MEWRKVHFYFLVLTVCHSTSTGFHRPRDAYAGGQEGQELPSVLNSFPSLLSAEEAFSGIVDSLVQENFSGGKPQTPKLSLYY